MNGKKEMLPKVVAKAVYKELLSKLRLLKNGGLNRSTKTILNLPFAVAMDTKTRQFNCKIKSRYLATNAFLKKVGIKLSSDCYFKGDANESLEHLFASCPHVLTFWKDLLDYLNDLDVKVDSLIKADTIFGRWERKDHDFLSFDHVLLDNTLVTRYSIMLRQN